MPTAKKSQRLATKANKQKQKGRGAPKDPSSSSPGQTQAASSSLAEAAPAWFLLPEIHRARSVFSRAEKKAPGHLISKETLEVLKTALQHMEVPSSELLEAWPKDPDTLSPLDGIFVYCYFSGDVSKMQSLADLKEAARVLGLSIGDCDTLALLAADQQGAAQPMPKAQVLVGGYLSILENRLENIKSQLAELDLLPDTDIFYEVPALKSPDSAKKLLDQARRQSSTGDEGKSSTSGA